jgi:hypothetical protein
MIRLQTVRRMWDRRHSIIVNQVKNAKKIHRPGSTTVSGVGAVTRVKERPGFQSVSLSRTLRLGFGETPKSTPETDVLPGPIPLFFDGTFNGLQGTFPCRKSC